MSTLGGGDTLTLGGGSSANVIFRGVTVAISGACGRVAETVARGGGNCDLGVTSNLGDEML